SRATRLTWQRWDGSGFPGEDLQTLFFCYDGGSDLFRMYKNLLRSGSQQHVALELRWTTAGKENQFTEVSVIGAVAQFGRDRIFQLNDVALFQACVTQLA